MIVNQNRLPTAVGDWLRLGAIGLFLAAPSSYPATLWTGPDLKFTQSSSSRSDTILAGKVVLTRGNRDVLYNTAAGERSAGSASPADTEWAFGTLDDFDSLSYDTLEDMRNSNLKARILNQPMVMHIISEDIYLSVKFTAWGSHLSGGFAYVRSTPNVAITPTVSITDPSSGAVLTAPATLHLSATATATGSVVTNVDYFAAANLLGSATTAPFAVDASVAVAGTYTLTAVATASGVSATSGVVNVTIVSPGPISLSSPLLSSGSFSFSYSADPGLSYVVQSSSDLLSWAAIITNVASSNPATFTDPQVAGPARFYRVGRMPNP
jgi:hypothetical protein